VLVGHAQHYKRPAGCAKRSPRPFSRLGNPILAQAVPSGATTPVQIKPVSLT